MVNSIQPPTQFSSITSIVFSEMTLRISGPWLLEKKTVVDRHDIWYNIDLESEMIELLFEDASYSKMHQGENECFR